MEVTAPKDLKIEKQALLRLTTERPGKRAVRIQLMYSGHDDFGLRRFGWGTSVQRGQFPPSIDVFLSKVLPEMSPDDTITLWLSVEVK